MYFFYPHLSVHFYIAHIVNILKSKGAMKTKPPGLDLIEDLIPRAISASNKPQGDSDISSKFK